MAWILVHFTSLLHRKQCNTQYIKGTGGKHTHIYTQTSKLVTDATPPYWLQSTTMLTSVISCYLSSMFLSCLRLPFCSYNMFFMVYSSTPSILMHPAPSSPLLSGPPNCECPVHYTEIYEISFLLHQVWILNVKT